MHQDGLDRPMMTPEGSRLLLHPCFKRRASSSPSLGLHSQGQMEASRGKGVEARDASCLKPPCSGREQGVLIESSLSVLYGYYSLEQLISESLPRRCVDDAKFLFVPHDFP
jgi:hypothetical protein